MSTTEQLFSNQLKMENGFDFVNDDGQIIGKGVGDGVISGEVVGEGVVAEVLNEILKEPVF